MFQDIEKTTASEVPLQELQPSVRRDGIELIAIYASSTVYGGVEVLIARFSRYLIDRGIPFVLITKKGTRLSTELSWAYQIDENEVEKLKGQITHLFLPNICALKKKLPWDAFSDAIIYTYIVHPTEIFVKFFPLAASAFERIGFGTARWIKIIFPFRTQVMQKLLQDLINRKALAVMDGSTERSLHYFFPKLTGRCQLIPITSPACGRSGDAKPKKDNLSIGYFGRMDAFKFSALKPFIVDTLASLKYSEPIQLHLVGDGDAVEKLSILCADYGVVFHNHGFQENSRAKKIIFENTDFAVCMGTAALDVASTGHPCIIIDPAHRANFAPQLKYRFVHELEDFTLGEYRDFPNYQIGLHSIAEIIEILNADMSIGRKGAEYVNRNHSPSTVFPKLVESISNSKLRSNEISATAENISRAYGTIRKIIGLKKLLGVSK